MVQYDVSGEHGSGAFFLKVYFTGKCTEEPGRRLGSSLTKGITKPTLCVTKSAAVSPGSAGSPAVPCAVRPLQGAAELAQLRAPVPPTAQRCVCGAVSGSEVPCGEHPQYRCTVLGYTRYHVAPCGGSGKNDLRVLAKTASYKEVHRGAKELVRERAPLKSIRKQRIFLRKEPRYDLAAPVEAPGSTRYRARCNRPMAVTNYRSYMPTCVHLQRRGAFAVL